ncbi:exodeoxyribonuclease V subunit alpha [Psychrobacter sp. F1192]|uniref:RecBCD enzyme subunit RecD n=1 Tax=Psychrobacter coccoides TaxID=2818440 RepID=A0ABS3NQJ3_9GAMM|nr:exodeoxyribonuclease V subunit alpha [Psychrobacter coccoides]MBO1531685.1 exodeoxyribonuclease V subunit alpha [Psychrobacter coccoides]
MSKPSNNKSIVGAQESWASNISDYILLRRQQTKAAYQTTTANDEVNTDAKMEHNIKDNGLFHALLIMLATHLEEGHTVLTIEADLHETPTQGRINGESVTLYAWQQRLLRLLAAPILPLAKRQIEALIEIPTDEISSAESSLFELLDVLFIRQSQTWAQLALSNHDKEMLSKRFNLVTAFYDLLKNSDFSTFVQTVAKHRLLADVNCHDINSLSRTNQPIIYQATKNKKNVTTQSITFWIHRTWQAEYNLANNIYNILNQQITPLKISIPKNLNKQQVAAINIANNHAFSIITGGPGTGKTYTVAQLVIALQQAAESGGEAHKSIKFSTDSASLALAAPTGKAAQRMQESLQAALDVANVELQLQEAKTIHRLLGIGRTGRPRYDANNPLGEDIIIVDEASMLGVELANNLVSAIKPGARLILLGDANQLAAVDAGAVLADLCRIPALYSIHAQLTESRRFDADSGIGKLAHQINKPDTDLQAIWQLLRQDKTLNFNAVNMVNMEASIDNTFKNSLSKNNYLKRISKNYINYIYQIKKLINHPIEKSMPEQVKNTITLLTDSFNQFRVLSAGHNGEWGDRHINNYLTQWHLTELELPLGQNTWFHGRPVMILQNNYELGLFNGDIGFCLQVEGSADRLEVFFENKTQGIAVNLLNEELVATAYAMTIHKSQGSEFDHVAITFDSSHIRLLSKELIYTAVTRAKKHVTIYSTKQAFELAVQTPTERYTGLGLQFENLD